MGNKCDLVGDREVSKEEGEAMAKSWSENGLNGNIPFFEASAKDKINDKEIFFEIVREMKKRNETKEGSDDKKKKKKRGLCTLL